MSQSHPIIAVTGSSGAGTATVMNSFAHIFRREGIRPQVIEGDSFHRYDRVEMRERVRRADAGEGPQISHFGPESNLLGELANAGAPAVDHTDLGRGDRDLGNPDDPEHSHQDEIAGGFGADVFTEQGALKVRKDSIRSH